MDSRPHRWNNQLCVRTARLGLLDCGCTWRSATCGSSTYPSVVGDVLGNLRPRGEVQRQCDRSFSNLVIRDSTNRNWLFVPPATPGPARDHRCSPAPTGKTFDDRAPPHTTCVVLQPEPLMATTKRISLYGISQPERSSLARRVRGLSIHPPELGQTLRLSPLRRTSSNYYGLLSTTEKSRETSVCTRYDLITAQYRCGNSHPKRGRRRTHSPSRQTCPRR